MKLGVLVRRFLLPGIFTTVLCLAKFRCMVSPRAEVDVNRWLKIGRKTAVSSFTKIKANGGPLNIGKQCSIGTGCFLSADEAGLTIGDFCMIGPNSSIIGNDYKYDRLDIPVCQQEKTTKGISIGNDVWIGAGCTVTDGVSIGDHCIIAPNSLVTKSLPPKTVALGQPAKRIFERR